MRENGESVLSDGERERGSLKLITRGEAENEDRKGQVFADKGRSGEIIGTSTAQRDAVQERAEKERSRDKQDQGTSLKYLEARFARSLRRNRNKLRGSAFRF